MAPDTGVPPGKGHGKEPGTGVPHPPKVWSAKQTENITFPHPSDAGGNQKVIGIHFAGLNVYTLLIVTRKDIAVSFTESTIQHHKIEN